jgi:hypothetical protein
MFFYVECALVGVGHIRQVGFLRNRVSYSADSYVPGVPKESLRGVLLLFFGDRLGES